jgi:predicted nucleic acid-binding protein
MGVAWDTGLVSRLRPGSDELEFLVATALTDDRPLIPLPSVAESVFGLSLRAPTTRPSAEVVWLVRLLSRPYVGVLPATLPAAIAAGRVRAAQPFPPPLRRRSRSKAERRVAWATDIQIGAQAWAVGVPVATENTADFEQIAQILGDLYPKAKPLDVLPSPV